jgi:hypothetical protein
VTIKMMRRTQEWYLAPLFAMLLYLVPGGWAQTVDFQINNPPSNNVMDDIYVGSYSANNVTPGGPGGSVQLICDDFKDNSDFNAATYTTNTFNSLGSTLWGSYLMGQGDTLSTVTKLYEEAAWLAIGLMGQTGQQQGWYSYALWAIFDASDVASWFTTNNDQTACNAVFGGGSWSKTNNSCSVGTGGLVGSAAAGYSSLTASQLASILIFTPKGTSQQPCSSPGTCPEQEFFEVVAEGGTAAMYLLLAGFACFGAMFFRSRVQADGGTLA